MRSARSFLWSSLRSLRRSSLHSFSQSLANAELSDLSTCASRLASSTDSSSLAGCPILTIFACAPDPSLLIASDRTRINRSTRLSTAMFDAEQHSTLAPRATSCVTYSTVAVVLPVPGGPWMRATSAAESACATASICDASRPGLTGVNVPAAVWNRGGTLPNMTSTSLAPTPTLPPGSPDDDGARFTLSSACTSLLCDVSFASLSTRSVPSSDPSGNSSTAISTWVSRTRYTTPSHSESPEVSPLPGRTHTTSCGDSLCGGSCGASVPFLLASSSVTTVLPKSPPRRSTHRKPSSALPLRCAVSGDIPFKMASLCSTSAARSSSSRALVRSTNASTVTSAALTVGAVPRLGSVLPRGALDAGGGASNAR